MGPREERKPEVEACSARVDHGGQRACGARAPGGCCRPLARRGPGSSPRALIPAFQRRGRRAAAHRDRVAVYELLLQCKAGPGPGRREVGPKWGGRPVQVGPVGDPEARHAPGSVDGELGLPSCFLLPQGTTRLLLTKIPFFREIIVSSFSCEHCGWSNTEIQSAGRIQDQGVRYTLTVRAQEVRGPQSSLVSSRRLGDRSQSSRATSNKYSYVPKPQFPPS